MSTITTYSIGDDTFTIKDTTLTVGDRILSRSFTIGGTTDNDVTIQIMYQAGIPQYGKMFGYPACSKGVLRILLEHIQKELPILTTIRLDDLSSGISKISLPYYNIIYNNKTWYEQHFHARLKDRKHPSEDGKDPEAHIPFHERYEHAKQFLDDPTTKIPFEEWKENLEFAEELREAYDSSSTYREFFKKIPKGERCRLIGRWLNEFMSIFMGDNISPNDWEIDIPTAIALQSGGKTRRKTHRKKRRQRTRQGKRWRIRGESYPVIGTLEDVEES
jgi:hypothetical protein